MRKLRLRTINLSTSQVGSDKVNIQTQIYLPKSIPLPQSKMLMSLIPGISPLLPIPNVSPRLLQDSPNWSCPLALPSLTLQCTKWSFWITNVILLPSWHQSPSGTPFSLHCTGTPYRMNPKPRTGPQSLTCSSKTQKLRKILNIFHKFATKPTLNCGRLLIVYPNGVIFMCFTT